jgi:hypothetical protein
MKRKKCTACGAKRVLSKFGRKYRGKPKLKARCKKCSRDYQVTWLSKPANYKRQQRNWLANGRDPDKKRRRRDRQLQRLYGITLEHWETLFREQQGCCAICRRKKRLLTDHNHKTGKFRGLICYPCNSAIGLLGDTIPNAKRLLTYLSKKCPN